MRTLRFIIYLAVISGIGLATIHALQADPQDTRWRQNMVAFMQTKMAKSKAVMEGLLTEDYRMVERAAGEMKRISEHTDWPQSKDAVYRHYTEQFLRQCDNLVTHAQNRDQDATHHAFMSITTSCIQCHKYVRRSLRVTHDESNPTGPVQLIPSDWQLGQIRPSTSKK